MENSWIWDVLITNGTRELSQNMTCFDFQETNQCHLCYFLCNISDFSPNHIIPPVKCTQVEFSTRRRLLVHLRIHLPFLLGVGLSAETKCSPSFAARSQLSREALALGFRPGGQESCSGLSVSQCSLGIQHQKVAYTLHRLHYPISSVSAILVNFAYLFALLLCLSFKLIHDLPRKRGRDLSNHLKIK